MTIRPVTHYYTLVTFIWPGREAPCLLGSYRTAPSSRCHSGGCGRSDRRPRRYLSGRCPQWWSEYWLGWWERTAGRWRHLAPSDAARKVKECITDVRLERNSIQSISLHPYSGANGLVGLRRLKLTNLISGPGGAGTLLGHSHAETLQTPVRISIGQVERSRLTLVTQSSSHVGLQIEISSMKAKWDEYTSTVPHQMRVWTR